MSTILASTSSIRAELLANAGLKFSVMPPMVDEGTLKRSFGNLSPSDLAVKLAEAKALSVSNQALGEIVIGADQVMSLAGATFDKPRDLGEARSHLLALRGRTHELHSALCCARSGRIEWRHCATASLTMRNYSTGFVDQYLSHLGGEVLCSVGAYRLEGEGIQLFDSIEGDYFTILGLPLLPLLGFLRNQAELDS